MLGLNWMQTLAIPLLALGPLALLFYAAPWLWGKVQSWGKTTLATHEEMSRGEVVDCLDKVAGVFGESNVPPAIVKEFDDARWKCIAAMEVR